MEATEIRIGNFIQKGKRIGRITAIHYVHAENSYVVVGNSNFGVFLEGITPIPLTEDIFIKHGFIKDTTNGTVWKDFQTHYLELREADGYYYPRYCQYGEISSESEQCVSLNRINSLHQLQNLYYELTGTELEIKL